MSFNITAEASTASEAPPQTVRGFASVASRQPLTTGISGLDDLVALHPGTLTAIYESPDGLLHEPILQTLISEAFTRDSESLVVCSADPTQCLRFLPRHGAVSLAVLDRLQIAWRYSAAAPQETRFRWDLSAPVNVEDPLTTYESLRARLQTGHGLVCIAFSLFGPLLAPAIPIETALNELILLARARKHTIVASIPRHILSFNPIWAFDSAVALHVELACPGETPYYAAIVELLRRRTEGQLLPGGLSGTKYGLRFSPRRIAIEPIDLPPTSELPAATSGCAPSF